MTAPGLSLATLRKLEWAGWDEDAQRSKCPDCQTLDVPATWEPIPHAPGCELKAEIDRLEARPVEAMPEIQAGDVVVTRAGNLDRVTEFDVYEWNHRRGFRSLVAALYRDPLWRRKDT
jgi:hypothetical protein